MTYKDITFCVAECATLKCMRNKKGPEYETEWLSQNPWMPVAWADFKEDCPQYVKLDPVSSRKSEVSPDQAYQTSEEEGCSYPE